MVLYPRKRAEEGGGVAFAVNGKAVDVVPATEESMCSFCISSALLMAGSLISTGGLAAFVGKKLGVKTGAKVTNSKNIAEGENHGSESSDEEQRGSSENRVAGGMARGSQGTLEKGEGIHPAA